MEVLSPALPISSCLGQLLVEPAEGFQEHRPGLGNVGRRDRMEVGLGVFAGFGKRSLGN